MSASTYINPDKWMGIYAWTASTLRGISGESNLTQTISRHKRIAQQFGHTVHCKISGISLEIYYQGLGCWDRKYTNNCSQGTHVHCSMLRGSSIHSLHSFENIQNLLFLIQLSFYISFSSTHTHTASSENHGTKPRNNGHAAHTLLLFRMSQVIWLQSASGDQTVTQPLQHTDIPMIMMTCYTLPGLRTSVSWDWETNIETERQCVGGWGTMSGCH